MGVNVHEGADKKNAVFLAVNARCKPDVGKRYVTECGTVAFGVQFDGRHFCRSLCAAVCHRAVVVGHKHIGGVGRKDFKVEHVLFAVNDNQFAAR